VVRAVSSGREPWSTIALSISVTFSTAIENAKKWCQIYKRMELFAWSGFSGYGNLEMDADLVEIIGTRVKGRAAVAKRHIRAGTIVVLEKPLAYVPFPDSSLVPDPATRKNHRLSEGEERVKMLPRQLSSTGDGSSFGGNLCILAARCYDASNSSAFEKERFSLLCDHIGHAKTNKHIEGLEECANIVLALIQSSARSAVAPKLSECREIICRLACNLFTIVDDFQNEAGVGCYPYAALLNHSCAPNCIQRFDSHGNITLRTNTDVSKGEELCISYIDTAMPTWYRQRELLQGYYFNCQCPRCCRTDPQDGYICLSALSQREPADNTGINIVSTGSQPPSKRASISTNSQCCKGLCHPCSDVTAYHAWVDGTARATTDPATHGSYTMKYGRGDGIESTVMFPFPYKWLLRTTHSSGTAAVPTSSMPVVGELSRLVFACDVCGSQRTAEDIATIVSSIQRQFSRSASKTHVAKAASGRPGSDDKMNGLSQQQRYETLYHVILRAKTVLPLLLQLVPAHHYCVLQLRKHLKSVFEQTLPVCDGTLQFPTITVHSLESNSRQSSSVGCDRLQSERRMSGAGLQALYEDNLREILAMHGYCYGTTAPTLCDTYYRVQYVWFVLSKHNSVVDETQSACRAHSAKNGVDIDIAAYREVHRMMPQLLRDVKTVYGGDHPFVASMEECAADVARVV
jgi:hypothetical protein